jgi:predicted alpha/beta-fold hydrolase
VRTGGFRPAWWLPGPHAQTVGARLLRTRRGVSFTRERIELPDGDFLDLDWPQIDACLPPAGAAPLVVVLHGLEGSARSTYAIESYRALARERLAAVGLNFRSCSGEINRLPRLYHSGETGDLGHVLRLLRDRFSDRPLGALGFSLGGNVLLKFLGETPDGEVSAAAAVSVPYDLGAGADHMERGVARLYRRYLVRKLQRKVRAKASTMRDRVDVARLLAARTFREFDGEGTAPLHGFRDADDYYGRSGSRKFLAGIRVPTLLLHALDDPFLPASAVPSQAAFAANPFLRSAVVPRGGHVGFVSGPPWAPVFWAERRASRFLAEQLHAAHPEPRIAD